MRELELGEKILLEYLPEIEDVNQGEPVEILPLTIIDMMLEYHDRAAQRILDLFAVSGSFCNCESLKKELHYGYGLPVCHKCNKVVKLKMTTNK